LEGNDFKAAILKRKRNETILPFVQNLQLILLKLSQLDAAIIRRRNTLFVDICWRNEAEKK
jgi:hypothetical protein